MTELETAIKIAFEATVGQEHVYQKHTKTLERIKKKITKDYEFRGFNKR